MTDGALLLPLARATIRDRLGLPAREPHLPAWTAEPGACFVTLHRAGRLRGCIGSLQAHRALADDVRSNALAAAFRDPRFPPLDVAELDDVVLEVSVLGTPQHLDVATEDELVAALRPGVDGVILEAPHRRGTYLPQVWEQLPDPGDFVRSLKTKAGLRPDDWSPDWRFSRYSVTAWTEEPA